MIAIYKREVQSYFSSMLGYIIVAVLTFLIAMFFSIYNLTYGYSSFGATLQATVLFFVFAVPMLTMRTFAEERRQKTDQLLFTSPVSVTKIVLAKYMSTMTIIAIPLFISCVCPAIISLYGNATLLKDYCTIFAMLCMCSLFTSIGIFISSLTDNQIVAVFLTLFSLFLLYLLDSLSAIIPQTPLVSAIAYLAVIVIIAVVLRAATRNNGLVTLVVIGCMVVWAFFAMLKWDSLAGSISVFLNTFAVMPVIQNFVNYSVFDVKGIFYYLSFSALFLFLTVQAIQRRRWN